MAPPDAPSSDSPWMDAPLSVSDEELELEQNEEDEDDPDDDDGTWEDWTDVMDGHEAEEAMCLCLFCPLQFPSPDLVFDHCSIAHSFDFNMLRRDMGLGFYESLRLLNYVRSEVSENRCWNCGQLLKCNDDLIVHLKASKHVALPSLKPDTQDALGKLLWNDDRYLTPFLPNDPLLYGFDEDEFEANEEFNVVDKSRIIRELSEIDINADTSVLVSTEVSDATHGLALEDLTGKLKESYYDVEKNTLIAPLGVEDASTSLANDALPIGRNKNENVVLSEVETFCTNEVAAEEKKGLKVSFAKVAAKEARKINQHYFNSYSEFGIHREMLSDRVRTETYQKAILSNPMLFKGSTVLDVGCGTGILSLFSAQSGAAKVIAVDGSEKMASVARQIATLNGFSSGANSPTSNDAIVVIGGMLEDIGCKMPVKAKQVDVIVSEWMGYCLLSESMLSTVLHARDCWLKEGGAILPDIANMYVAGFGKGGTSLSFWEDVYGFNMQCIGQEIIQHAAEYPIIDVIDGSDVITETHLFQSFDLSTMRLEDADFTTTFSLKLKPHSQAQAQPQQSVTWCYGLVIWFDTQFSARFCKESPAVLTTSPFAPKTHWAQTLLTFREPIALSNACDGCDASPDSQALGTMASPAAELSGRFSMARSVKHRTIDISLEPVLTGKNGCTRTLPVQMFDV